MKRSITNLQLKTFLIFAIFCLCFLAEARQPKLIVDNDTVTMLQEETYDTVIVRNNGLLVTNFINILKLCQLETGGRIKGNTVRTWFGMDAAGIRVINNSGPNAFENVEMSLRATGINAIIGGTYPSTFNAFFSGFGGRDIHFESDVRVTGRIFNGYANVLNPKGNDLILGPDAYCGNLSKDSHVFLVGDGSRVIKEVHAGVRYSIPLSSFSGAGLNRTDVYFTVNPSSVLGANPKVILQLFSDSIPVQAQGAAVTDYFKRFIKVSFEDISNPSIDFSVEGVVSSGPSYPELTGNIDKILSARWNGTKWLYGALYNKNINLLEYKNVTETSILAAGRNFGLATSACYAPQNPYFTFVTDTTATITWNAETPAPLGYLVDYAPLSSSTWVSAGALSITNKDTITGLTINSKYNARLRTVCAVGDTSNYSVMKYFKTSIPALKLRAAGITTLLMNVPAGSVDTFPSFLVCDTVRIFGAVQAVDNITANRWIAIEDTITAANKKYKGLPGTMYLDQYQLLGPSTCRTYIKAGTTFRYGSKYLKNEVERQNAAMATLGLTKQTHNAANYWLNGNLVGSDGQMINNDFPQQINSLRLSTGGRVSVSRSSNFSVTNKLIIDSVIYTQLAGSSLTGYLQVDGNEFVNNVDSLVLDATNLIFNGKATVLSGTGKYVKANSITIGLKTTKAKLTLEQDLYAADYFYLDSGEVYLNGHNLILDGIDKQVGHIISNNGGNVQYQIKSYGSVKIPFGLGFPYDTTVVFFNPISGTMEKTAIVNLNLDTIKPALGNAPMDYINRFLTISFNDYSSPIYNMSFNYINNDIKGTEAMMENQVYSAGQWINSKIVINDTVNKVFWYNCVYQGVLSAGNYLGFDTVMAVELSSKDITTQAATLDWKFYDEGVNNWNIYYAENSSSTWTSVPVISATSKRISGLTASTTYKWYVATTETAGYPKIANSDTLTFTTLAGTCDKPVGLTATADYDFINVNWSEGQSNYTLQYRTKKQSWASASVINGLTTQYRTLTGLDTARVYVVRVQSACGSYSDSLVTNTLIPNYNASKNSLYINSKQTIPSDFVFNKITIDSLGDAYIKENINFIDTLLLMKGGELICDTFVAKGFAFVSQDSSLLYSAHKTGLSKIDTLGNIRVKSAYYHPLARYTYNGKVPQKLNIIVNAVKDKYGTSDYFHTTLDNPTTVQMPDHKIIIRKNFMIKQGVMLLNQYNYTVSMNAKTTLTNNSGMNAFNNHKCYLTLSGGSAGVDDNSVLTGTATTWVDSLSFGSYGDPLVTSDLRIASKLNVKLSSGAVGNAHGIQLKGKKLIMDAGSVIVTENEGRIIPSDSASVEYYVNASNIDSTIFIPFGDLSLYYNPFKIKFKTGTTLGSNAFIKILPLANAHVLASKAPEYIKRYVSVDVNNISTILYDLSFVYATSDVVGVETAMNSVIYPSVGVSDLDSVVSQSNMVKFSNATVLGDITARTKNFDTKISENKALANIKIGPNPTEDFINIEFESVKTGAKIIVLDMTGRQVAAQDVKSTLEVVHLKKNSVGVYFVVITDGFNRTVSKIVKK